MHLTQSIYLLFFVSRICILSPEERKEYNWNQLNTFIYTDLLQLIPKNNARRFFRGFSLFPDPIPPWKAYLGYVGHI